MATITSTIDNFSMSSNYTCTTSWYREESPGGYTEYSFSYDYSSGSLTSKTITFSYSNISEQINLAVLSLTSLGNTYGGSFSVNGTKVYPSNGQYIVYLDASAIGASSSTFTLTFSTNGIAHDHRSNYDSRTQSIIATDTDGSRTIKYVAKKSHTGTLSLGNVNLKIYTGNDSLDVASTAGFFVGVGGVARKVSEFYVGVSNKARKVSEGWIGINGKARKFWPTITLKDVTVGSTIKIDELGDGNLVNYIVVAQNHYLNSTNTAQHTVLMRTNLLNTTSKYGNNTYGEAYVGEALDIYVNETWKASLDGRIILKLMNITIPCNQWSSPYTSSAERQIWVPSKDEIDSTFSGKEGPVFEYFSTRTTNADRIAKTSDGTAQTWWTRTCVAGTSPYVNRVLASGGINNTSQSSALYLRPVFCLSNSLPVSQVSTGVYDLIL